MSNHTFIKFAFVGIINTVVGTAVMYIFYNVGRLGYWPSSAANYIVGGLISYFLNKRFTFEHKGDVWGSAWRFVLNIVVCYVIAYAVAKPLVAALLTDVKPRVRDNIAMGVGVVLYILLNYLGQRFFAFRNRDAQHQDTPAS